MKRMLSKDYQDKIEELSKKAMDSNPKWTIKFLLLDNTKWYWLAIIWCWIAVISIICNIIQLFI